MKKFLAGFVFAVFCFSFVNAEDDAVQRQLNVSSSLHQYDFDPFTASYTAEAQLFSGIYEGLFSYDPQSLEPVPAICQSFKVSRDRLKWTFTLRDGVKFSDGTPITAQSVKDSWLGLLSQRGAPFASLIDCVSGARAYRTGEGSAEDVRIQARDEKTLVVYLDEYAAHLPKILCHHAFSVLVPGKKVYSGAFVLDSADSTSIVLKKNENYWDAANVKLPSIKISLSDDFPENAFVYNMGETDWVDGNAEAAKIIDKNAIHISAEFGTVYLFFKNANFPWNLPEFRNALLSAVPYEKLRENYSVKAETLLCPLSGYPKVSGINVTDEEDALDIMKNARKKYGIKEDEKIPLVFAITSDPYIKKWAELLEEAWAPLGVELVTQSTPNTRYNSSIPGWNADLFYYSWIGDFADPLAFLELFRNGSSLNVAKYSNEKYDEYVSEALRQTDLNEQYGFYSKAEQILLDDGEVIPIAHPVSMHILDLREIGGWYTNALDLHPLKYIFFKNYIPPRNPNMI